MTTAQRRKYFCAVPRGKDRSCGWGHVCKVNGWRMQAGCMANAEPLPTQSEWVSNALALAGGIAAQEHRAVKPDDVRYAVHYIVKRKACSSDELTNRELTRVFLYFRLMCDAEDFEALNEWLHPELDERRSIVERVRRAPAAYVAEVAGGRFGTRNWEGLGLEDLRALVRILTQREVWRRGVELRAGEPF